MRSHVRPGKAQAENSAAGRNGAAIAPPSYGIDSVQPARPSAAVTQRLGWGSLLGIGGLALGGSIAVGTSMALAPGLALAGVLGLGGLAVGSMLGGPAPAPAAAAVPGPTAVTLTVAKLKTLMSKDSNYSVGLLSNGDLIISKVNGVTGAAAGMDELQRWMRAGNMHVGRNIYLAQKYNTSIGSNHAEMCIVAAAARMGLNVAYMGCTGPNCPFCAATLKDLNVDSMNEGEDGKAQQGWAHPTANVFWGSQVSNTPVSAQVADLKLFLRGGQPKIGRNTLSPSQGRYTRWL